MLRARVHVTHAVSRVQRGDRRGAFELLDEADRLLVGAPANQVSSLAVVQRAGLHGRVGEWHAAAALLEALPLTRHVAPRTRCLIHLNLGLCYQFLGRYGESDARLLRAQQHAVALGYPDLAAAAVHNRGRLHLLLGDLPRALALLSEAGEHADEVLPPGALLDRARVLAEAGLIDRALETLEDGARAARAGGIAHDLAEADLERARLALLREDPAAARTLAARAERRFRHRSEEAWAVRATLLRLQAEVLTGRRPQAVATALTELADGPARTSAVGAEAAVLAAEAAARVGDLDEARRQLARPDVRRTASFPLRLHRTLVLAEVHAAEGRTDLVRRELRRGVQRLVTEQARHTSLDSRTAVALHSRRLREAHLDLALGRASASQVFDATELWRGVSHRLPPLSAPPDAELARLTADARRLHTEAAETSDPRRRRALEVAARDAERAVARRDWSHAGAGTDGSGEQLSPVTLAALRPVLREARAGLLSLFIHRDDLWAVTVTPDETRLTRVVDLPAVVEAAQRLRADLVTRRLAVGTPMEAVVRRSMERSAAMLGALLGPTVPRAHRLVVIPSAALASIPWRLVPGIAGHLVTVAPSATFWARRSRRAEPGPAPRVAALAGPGLARAHHEVADVAAAWHDPLADVASGAVADGRQLRAALRSAAVVHVAAHGVHQDESPLFSSLLMRDGPVFAHELQRGGVRADHVVLSSCEVGRTHVRPGDEPLGLTASLLATGVRSVVAAVGPVGDDDAHAVMSTYHRLLARGMDTAEALEIASAGVDDGRLFCAYGADWAAPWPGDEPAQMKMAGSAKSAS
ncbi:CHAT domain-containing protein [Phycicoccus sonneratiae]|uniref:CHAT domain-containing protein n=1 Tax=Phycicoccus sonneratiae TaxID=2807628 RepID=A0ABS2CNZ8_9MICO|nr:CHAT domain-containing tetratricopeptide repeat protein [Phycicoccus sonneraticus]MBM6401609.1 CHAT domain-containing protein [Phycicoccus sonneraticus]